MRLALEDTVALVAGSSRGIGRAVAEGFLAEGARVMLTGRAPEPLEACARELAEGFGEDRIGVHVGDLTDSETAAAAVERTYERFGRLDSLVLNVGTGRGAPGWQSGKAEWERLFDANLWASVWLVEAALIGMVDAGRGSVVFVGSIAGLEDVGAPLPYAAAKAALASYARGLARRLGPTGIRVNCVAPGNVLHPGGTWEQELAERRGEVEAAIEREVPLRRFGRPEEIARAVVFLCSDAASFVTGSILAADGGQMRGR